jgi:hypothetical protein
MKMMMKKYGCGFIQSAMTFARKWSLPSLLLRHEENSEKIRSFSEAEKADRDFYKKLTGNERL